MTAQSMDKAHQKSSPKRRRLQFTMRELLLLMVAISFFFAWWQSSGKVKTTPFYLSFDISGLLDAAAIKSGGQFQQTVEVGDYLPGSQAAVVQLISKGELKTGSHDDFLKALSEQIEKTLADSGCEVTDSQINGSFGQLGFQTIEIYYFQGRTHGKVRISSRLTEENELEQFILVKEVRK